MYEIEGKYTKALITLDSIEPKTIGQIISMTNHHAFTNPIVIMPDAHYGKGSCVGFTMEMNDYVIPNIIGVDIGCGIDGYLISDNLKSFDKETLERIDNEIKNTIPLNINVRKDIVPNIQNRFQKIIEEKLLKAKDIFNIQKKIDIFGIDHLKKICEKVDMDYDRALKSIGSLGGGNHFIEIGIVNKDIILDDMIWLTIHCGSRQFGEKVCKYHSHIAKNNKKEKFQ